MELVKEYIQEHKLEMNLNGIKSKYKCQICENILIKPKVTKCGCRFCYSCIENYFIFVNNESGSMKICPGCRGKDISFENDIVDDFVMQNKLQTLEVHCPNLTCIFRGTVEELGKHVRQCDSVKVKCVFNEIGCINHEIRKSEMRDHLENNVEFHMKLMLEQIEKKDNEMKKKKDELTSKIQNLENIFTKLERKMNDLENKFVSNDKKINVREKQFEDISLDMERKSDRIKKLECNMVNFKENDKFVYGELQEIKCENQKLKEKLSKFEIMMNEFKSEIDQNVIPFINQDIKSIEKIVIFRHIKDKPYEVQFHSEKFYLNKYYFQVEAFKYLRDEIAFRLIMLKGLHDNELKWPLKNKMVLSILNETGEIVLLKQFQQSTSFRKCDFQQPRNHVSMYDSLMKGNGDLVIFNDSIQVKLKMFLI